MIDSTDSTQTSTGTTLTAREKRDLQKAQLRPLANLRPELYDEDDYSQDELETMMEMYNGTMASIEEGEIVKSRVLDIRDNMVVLDIGFKSEGTIPLEEFKVSVVAFYNGAKPVVIGTKDFEVVRNILGDLPPLLV